jgi:hypothetical protein
MSIHWIVPMRRLVVRAECTYSQLMWAWLATLDVRKLAEWYWPLVAGSYPTYGSSTTPLDRSMEGGIRSFLEGALEQQKRRLQRALLTFLEPPPTEHTGSAQTGANAFGTSQPFLARLWKGPWRTLIDLAAGRDDSDEDASNVGYDAQRRVTRRNAVFLPGDVVEFPIFVLLRDAGVAAMNGVEFNPHGSFLTGTSVWKRVERGAQPPDAASPRGVVRLHDNLMAMHFQSLLNAALCGWYADGRVYRAGGRLDDGCFAARVEGQGRSANIRARGLVYGATLADPMSGGDRLFSIININHRSGRVVANGPTLGSFPPGEGRFTWGWACNPAQLLLAYYMAARTDSWSPGATPMRHATTLRSGTQPMVYLTRTRWAARVSLYFAPMQEAEETQDARRARLAAERLAARRMAEDPDYVEEPSRTLTFHERHERVLQQSLNDPDIAVRQETDEQQLRALYERAQRTVLTELAGRAWLPATAAEQRRSFDATPHATRGSFRFQATEATVEVDRATMLRTFCSTLTPVVLDGHCFTYVRVWPHAKLLSEPTITTATARAEDADPGDASLIDGAAPLVGPPTTSLIAAYNPVTGEPYATTEEGELYNFEASGSLNNVKARSHGGPDSIFGAKAFVWRKMYGLNFHAVAQKKGGWIVAIAERYTDPADDPPNPGPTAPRARGESPRVFRARSAPRRAWENSQPQPRTKNLVCFSFFEEQLLRRKYAMPRAFEPIAFSKTGAGGDQDDVRELAAPHRDRAMLMHASRAVPLETFSEAETVPEIASRYQTLSRMRSNRTQAREALQRWLASLPPNPPLAEGETEDSRPATQRDRVQAAIHQIDGTRESGGG